jgi:hypothetical protein
VFVLNQALYAFPASKTQGAYDSFLWNGIDTCYAFQITIAEKRNILNQAVKKFLQWIAKSDIKDIKVKFVFMVPSTMIDKWNQPQVLVGTGGKVFKKSGYELSIDQYIVSLDI